jgi:hypothetical protein
MRRSGIGPAAAPFVAAVRFAFTACVDFVAAVAFDPAVAREAATLASSVTRFEGRSA